MRRAGLVAVLLAAVLAADLGVAWASSLVVTSKHLGTSPITTPVMYPVSVTTTDSNTGVGRIRQGDKITFVWSAPVDEPSLCSGWTNSLSTRTLTMTWTATDGTTSDDVLRPAAVATCITGLHVGSFDFGRSDYINGGTVTYTGCSVTLTVGATTTTLAVTLGSDSGGGSSTSVGGAVGTWTPDAAVTDRAAHSVGTNLAITTETLLF